MEEEEAVEDLVMEIDSVDQTVEAAVVGSDDRTMDSEVQALDIVKIPGRVVSVHVETLEVAMVQATAVVAVHSAAAAEAEMVVLLVLLEAMGEVSETEPETDVSDLVHHVSRVSKLIESL